MILVAFHDDTVQIAPNILISGVTKYQFLKNLSIVFLQNQENGKSPENYTYFQGKKLAYTLSMLPPSFRKMVYRLRDDVGIKGFIENKPWKGIDLIRIGLEFLPKIKFN